MATPAVSAPDPTTDKPPRRRRSIPLSLRMFMAILVLLGIATVCLGVRGYHQFASIQEIERVGGAVYVERLGPEWFRERIGEERMIAFDCAWGVVFTPDRATLTKRFPGGDSSGPWVKSATIDDASLPCGTKLPNIKHLGLACTNISDAGISHVATLAALEFLDLTGTDASDASIPFLKRLTKLKELRIRGTKITDGGIDELKLALPLLKIERHGATYKPGASERGDPFGVLRPSPRHGGE